MGQLVRRPPPPPSAAAGTPLVSCLTLTRARPDLLRRAIGFYDRQTWPNKELVVVVDRRSDTGWVDSFFHEQARPDLRWAMPAAVEHLGALRNQALDLARGDYVCVWDDDDFYHPFRLEWQVRTALAEGVDAVLLAECMHYFEDSGELFLSFWQEIGLPPSLLCRRDRMLRYRETLDPILGQKGSDTALQQKLIEEREVALLTDCPYLYTYVYHGENVWNRTHHILLAFNRIPSDLEVDTRLPGLRERLGEMFPGPLPATLLRKEGTSIPLP